MSQPDRKKLLGILTEGIRELSLDLNDRQCEKLLDYIELLQKWNGVYNLTAVRDPEQMVKQHLLDCLAALPAFQGVHEVLDVGAGGGLPGIVLAIACPDMQVSLIDTVQKKTAFLTQVKAELGLGNVTVHTGRVEQLADSEKYEVITSRAFADLSDFIKLASHLLKDHGRFIAMKGAVPQAEIANLPADWHISNILPLAVPGLQAQRHLITMERGQK
jgi:16S rRNA (guanine527-N7)-methyltransferase